MAASRALILSFFASTALAAPHPPGHGPWDWSAPTHESHRSRTWGLKTFTTLVALGDSYTDDNRLNYFLNNNGTPPPIGWLDPVNYAAADGGRVWAQYVKQYTGVNLYNYAVSGAVCSNSITPRAIGSLGFDFPAVEQYEVPAYIADSQHIEPDGTKFLIEPVDETVYAIWIGTNDLGVGAFITDSQVKGTNLVDFTHCVYDSLKQVYDNGGRYFVLMNVAPLNLAPLYALPDAGGVSSDSSYWPDKPVNLTAISYRMMEQVVTVNSIFDYQTPFVSRIGKDFGGAKFAVLDMHGLFTDIYNNPSSYLNGTAPLNVTGAVHRCDASGTICSTSPSPDSYMWYDDLHPSEQTERIVARTFVEAVKGTSKWATYW